MIHSKTMLDCLKDQRGPAYRDESFLNVPEDRPLIAQFCGNDPQLVLQAAMAVVSMGFVDAVDLNLGCPQGIAKRGKTII
jgi:tRNA-dihydrouridine synthase 1